MSEDPILKLAVHLEKHRDHQQAFFSTRALRTLLERLGAADGKLEGLTKECDKLKLHMQDYHQMHDHERDLRIAAEAERDTYKESWERLTVEKAQSSWGEFQRQGKMLKEMESLRDSWKERAEALEAQVKRLLAKQGERIELEALNKRLDEPLPELRRDANGDPIPWPKDADYFMGFDPENPDTPTD
jgi:chromosome segregation ATPase